MDNKFKKDLEKLLKKNEDSLLAGYIAKCLKDYNVQTEEQVNPFGVEIQPPEVAVQQAPKSNAAPVGNNPTTTGWSNPFAGTSWGV